MCVCVCVCTAHLSHKDLVVRLVKDVYSDDIITTQLQHPVVAWGNGETKQGRS